MKMSGNTILITGGGSGIGMALAHGLHDAGNTVIISGRRRDALDRASEGRVNMRGLELDVTDPDAIFDFIRRILSEYPGLTVLINNAGLPH